MLQFADNIILSCKTWKLVLDLLEKRLATWKGKYVSIEGRVVLIDYILTSLPLYFDEAGRAWLKHMELN
jgi:hypothetical protein